MIPVSIEHLEANVIHMLYMGIGLRLREAKHYHDNGLGISTIAKCAWEDIRDIVGEVDMDLDPENRLAEAPRIKEVAQQVGNALALILPKDVEEKGILAEVLPKADSATCYTIRWKFTLECDLGFFIEYFEQNAPSEVLAESQVPASELN